MIPHRQLSPHTPRRSAPPSPNPRSAAASPLPSPRRMAGAPALANSGPKDFSYLLRPELYRSLPPQNVPAPFRSSPKQPGADTPIAELIARGHFRAAAIAAANELTGVYPVIPGSRSGSGSSSTAEGPASRTPVDPKDHARIFDLFYTRLACLTLAGATAAAAQEVKALEDLNAVFYLDPATGAHLVPWPLRVLNVRLQALGFGDPRRAVMSFYELARDARARLAMAYLAAATATAADTTTTSSTAAAAAAGDDDEKSRSTAAAVAAAQEEAELWKDRLAEIGIRVAGALVEMDDFAGAAHHLASLREPRDGRLAMAKALLWLQLGHPEASRACMRRAAQHGWNQGGDDGGGDDEKAAVRERVIEALCDMADGEYAKALSQWQELRSQSDDEMIGVNLAVCLLYVGDMQEGKSQLEDLVGSGRSSNTLLFNLTTMYELCTDRARSLKMQLTEKVASMDESPYGWEKSNVDFKL